MNVESGCFILRERDMQDPAGQCGPDRLTSGWRAGGAHTRLRVRSRLRKLRGLAAPGEEDHVRRPAVAPGRPAATGRHMW